MTRALIPTPVELSRIELLNCRCENKTLIFDFSYTDDLKEYISGTSIRFEYDVSLDRVPQEVLMVVFVANFLPFAWCFQSEIVVPVLDREFFECIPRLEEVFHRHVYRSRVFRAHIVVGEVREATLSHSREKTALFFSGGLDAMQSLLEHLDKKPDLVSVLGADIEYDNVAGWNHAYSAIQSTAAACGVEATAIRTNARDIENTRKLNRFVRSFLNKDWWGGIKFAIALFGWSAPLAYVKGYRHIYISSSFDSTSERIEEGTVILSPCASTPLTDECVRFCGTSILHNGYRLNRQEKYVFVVEACHRLGCILPLRVCWKNDRGDNCCHCEKCFHGVLTLLVLGEDPVEYGFNNYRQYLTKRRFLSVLRKKLIDNLRKNEMHYRWISLRDCILERQGSLLQGEHADIYRWIIKHDFRKPEDVMPPWRLLFERLRQRLRGY